MVIRKKVLTIGLASCLVLSVGWADSVKVPVHKTKAKGEGQKIGYVKFQDTQYGLLIKPNLKGLKPGLHGFHIHQKPNCDDNGKAAGGHLDPKKTDKHLGPYNPKGHLGDLPVLYVKHNGHANIPTLAPRLSVKKIQDHALIIHKQGDNYSDQPKSLGGGGARVACGVIYKSEPSMEDRTY